MNTTRLVGSRNTWKEKAAARASRIAILNKRLARRDARIALMQGEILELKQQLKAMPLCQASRKDTRVLCVTLFVLGVVPCSAVERVLGHFQTLGCHFVAWVPDASSVVNWIARAGLGLLKMVKMISEPWVAVIDTSISMGKCKVLVVLRVPLTGMGRGCALGLANVECIGLEVSESWTGESVCNALTRCFSKSGNPCAFLQDGGFELAKAAKLIKKTIREIHVISDVGHFFANVLKRKYSHCPDFKRLLVLANGFRSRVMQTNLFLLRPPKIRSKGRFQSISKLVIWAQRMQKFCGGRGRSKAGSLQEQVRKLLPQIGNLSMFLESFLEDCRVVNSVQEILKNRGLNQQTYAEAKAILSALSTSSKIRSEGLKWLAKQIQLQCRLGIGQTPLTVSSDVIESLMGKLKLVISRHGSKEFSTLTLSIPLMCGALDNERIASAIDSVSHNELSNWRRENQRQRSNAKANGDLINTIHAVPNSVRPHVLHGFLSEERNSRGKRSHRISTN